jgi:Predicted sugar kinase
MKIKIISKKNYPELKKLYSKFDISDNAEVCLAVGGDGTFIKAANEFDGLILPIRSAEKNSTGYYADVDLNQVDFIIKSLLSKNYKVEELGRKVEVDYEKSKYYGVNEILLKNIQGEVYFKLYYDEKGRRSKLYEYTLSGDGLLVTSAIGSTAYNRTAGGPIIMDKNVLCLTFLSIENPLTNSVILRKDEKLHVEIEKGIGVLSYDGIVIGDLNQGKSFDIRLSDRKVKVLKLNNRNEEFSEKLLRIIKSKMN